MTVAAFIVFCAFWRLWLGGVPRGFPTGLKYAVGVAGVALFVYLSTADAMQAVTHGLLFLAYWRALGHGAMLRYPLGPDTDPIYKAVRSLPPDFAWWAYAALRYVGFALLWALVIKALGYRFPGELLIAGIGICVTYRALANARLPYGWLIALGGVPKSAPLPDGYHDEFHAHYCEPVAGAMIGAALVSGVAPWAF